MDKKDDNEDEFKKETSQSYDPSEVAKDFDDLRDLIKDLVGRGEPSRTDVITGSGINSLKRLLEEISSGKIKASVHVLGDVGSGSGRRGMVGKITECLPCIAKVFADLYFDDKEDEISHAGHMCFKVLIECMKIDLTNGNSESCNKLALTLEKFCDLTGLNEIDHFKSGYHTFD